MGRADRLPGTIKLLPNPKKTMGFHGFAEYDRLLAVAQKRDPQAYPMVLVGGDAGRRKKWRYSGDGNSEGGK